MEKENIEVFVSFVRINTPRGGDFYLCLSSSKIKNSNDLNNLDLDNCANKREVLEKIHAIDPNAKVVGGIILCRDTKIKYAGVYKQSDSDVISIDAYLEALERNFPVFKEAVKNDLTNKGGR